MEVWNWLYVQNERASLHLDHDAIRIRMRDADPTTLPLHSIEGIVCFGAVNVTTPLIHRCADDGRSLVFLTYGGRFKGRVEGPRSGNVLLRRAQHLAAEDQARTREIARSIVAGKIQASRGVLLRAARDDGVSVKPRAASDTLALVLDAVRTAGTLDSLRGLEGQAAAAYFDAFATMVRTPAEEFAFDKRSRRPPRDRLNALLSFLYTLAQAEVLGALETTGLDPQIGFLHALRPGRPGLALDLLEELRGPLLDRLALSLVNRRQLRPNHFDEEPGGAVLLNEEGRRIVLTAYRERKLVEVEHPLLRQHVPWGLIPHVQARVLARHLRGDVTTYIPFVPR